MDIKRITIKWFFVLTVLMMILGLQSCGSGGGSNSQTPSDSTNKITGIGSAGGTVISSDGKASVTIPAGALSAENNITVEAESNPPSGSVGAAYKFGPDGTIFNSQVTISIKYDETSIPAGVNESSLGLGHWEKNQWVKITDATIDAATNIVSGKSIGFSVYGVIVTSESSASDTTLPQVSYVSPADGFVGVPVNGVITAAFSEAMDSATINAESFTLVNTATDERVAGTVTYDSVNRIATFTPSANFSYNTSYTVTITTGVKDAVGNALASNYAWTFTTGSAPDTTPPTVDVVTPFDGSTGVTVNATITATFSESMDASTITPSTFMVSSGVTGSVTYDSVNRIATFIPSASLSYNTSYTVTITSGVKDAAGNALTDSYAWTFTTLSENPQWVTSIIDNGGDVGGYPSIAIDSNNNVHASYYDFTNEDLKYATNISGNWAISTVDSNDAGMQSSLAIDSTQKAHISYNEGGYYSGVLYFDLRYATNRYGLWKSYVVDSQVSFFSTESSITLWEGANTYGPMAQIVYFDNDSDALKFKRMDYQQGGTFSWIAQTIDSGVDGIGLYLSSVRSSPNCDCYLSVSYYDSGSEDLQYATNITGPWVTSLIDSTGDVGSENSITVDSNYKVHISYYDSPNEDLKFATNISGNWVTSTIDSTGGLWWDTSIAIDSNNKVHISYGDSTNKDLKYATNISGNWVTSTIDSTGDVGLYTSIALDSSDKVYIIYYDITNGDLKLAHQ